MSCDREVGREGGGGERGRGGGGKEGGREGGEEGEREGERKGGREGGREGGRRGEVKRIYRRCELVLTSDLTKLVALLSFVGHTSECIHTCIWSGGV